MAVDSVSWNLDPVLTWASCNFVCLPHGKNSIDVILVGSCLLLKSFIKNNIIKIKNAVSDIVSSNLDLVLTSKLSDFV